MAYPKPNDLKRPWDICGSIWEVKFKKEFKSHPKTLGVCDPSENIIWIKSGMSDRETFVTFVHELLHAFEMEMQITISHQLICKLQYPFADFILENFMGGE